MKAYMKSVTAGVVKGNFFEDMQLGSGLQRKTIEAALDPVRSHEVSNWAWGQLAELLSV